MSTKTFTYLKQKSIFEKVSKLEAVHSFGEEKEVRLAIRGSRGRGITDFCVHLISKGEKFQKNLLHATSEKLRDL